MHSPTMGLLSFPPSFLLFLTLLWNRSVFKRQDDALECSDILRRGKTSETESLVFPMFLPLRACEREREMCLSVCLPPRKRFVCVLFLLSVPVDYFSLSS